MAELSLVSDKRGGRGKTLTAFLMLASLLWAYLYLFSLPKAFLRINDWRYWSSIVIPLLSLIGIILMWRWIKLGAYLFYASIILFLFTPPLLAPFFGLHTKNILMLEYEYIYLFIAAAALSGLMYLLFRHKWHLFK